MAAQTWGGQPFLFFAARDPGTYKIEVALNVWRRSWETMEQEVETARIDPLDLERIRELGQYLAVKYPHDSDSIDVVVSGDPNPPDPPDPPDPEPGGKKQVLLLHESDQLDDMSVDQRLILCSLCIREEFVKRGHRLLGVLDVDIVNRTGKVPAKLAPFFRACEGDELPRVVIAPLAGGAVKDYPLPDTQEAFWKLIEGVAK